MLQRGAAGGQLLYVWVADGAVGGEEEFAQARQAAGEVLETPGAALQGGTPAQVQLLQHPEQAHTKQRDHTGVRYHAMWSATFNLFNSITNGSD